MPEAPIAATIVLVSIDQPDNRRKYRRIRAPVYCRPAGMEFLARAREPIDVSLGGVRIFSDLRLKIGQLLKLEFFLVDAPPTTYTAEVVWIEALPPGPDSPGKFDVGLKFIQLEPAAMKLLMSVLGPTDPDDSVDPEDPGVPKT